MLIAGGIGITHPMSYIHEFMEGYAEQTIAIRRVNLIWVVRSLGMSSSLDILSTVSINDSIS